MVCSTAAHHTSREAPSGAWRVPSPRAAPTQTCIRALSDRDRELVCYLAEGRSTGQIAAALSVSSNTARTRIRRVTRKLAAPGRHQVVDAARALDLI